MQSNVQNYMQSSIIMPMVCEKTKAEKIAIQNAATAEWVSLIQCGHPSGVKSTCKYEKKYGIDIRVVAVGTGQALKNAENGDCDLIIVHSKDDEKKFVANGYGLERKELMYNDFIIIGPKNDPENLRLKDNIKAVSYTHLTLPTKRIV